MTGRIVHVGVISDTHGLVREAALHALVGVDLVLHGGDVGAPAVLETLRRLAPVHAVRGNNDRDAWAGTLPLTETVTVHAHRLYLLHDLADLDLDPAAAGFAAVISGHTHRPRAHSRAGVLYLNPGSAGPRRFSLPVTVARLRVGETAIAHEIIELAV